MVGLPEAISTTISCDYNNAIMASSPKREIYSTQHQRPHNLLKSSCHSVCDPDNINSGSMNNLCDDRSSLKLPPITNTHTVISAHHNTTGND